MYIHALREMMLGMKIDMLENKVSINPQLDMSILPDYGHFAFEHGITGKGRFQATIDPYNRKILLTLKGWQGARPEFLTNPSYNIDVVASE
jgi:hypothetical protein